MDPTTSTYGNAYLAVFERSCVCGSVFSNITDQDLLQTMVEILRSLHSLFPLTSTRHWFFWVGGSLPLDGLLIIQANTFSAAVCLATMCIISPASPLVDLALSKVDEVVSLFTTVLPTFPGGGLRKNLKCLVWLREQYCQKAIDPTFSQSLVSDASTMRLASPSPVDATGEHMSLVGWKTRLVEFGEDRQGAVITQPRSSNGDQQQSLFSLAATPGLDVQYSAAPLPSEEGNLHIGPSYQPCQPLGAESANFIPEGWSATAFVGSLPHFRDSGH